MSKFCGNCGAVNNDTAVICESCGNSLLASAPVTAKKKSSTGKMAAIAVVAVAVIVLIISLFSGGSDKVVKKIVKAYDNEDAEALMKLYPEFMADGFEDNIEETSEAQIEGFYLLLSLADIDTDDVKLSYKIKDEDKYDKDELEDLAEEFEEYFDDFEEKKLKAAIDYEVDVTIKSDGEEEEMELIVHAFKYGGKWYGVGEWDI